jgi:acetyltransferase-like isoleucine patch superfamily enzyme
MNLRIRSELANIIHISRIILVRAFGYKNISSRAVLEGGILLDKVNKKGIYIGDYTLVAAKAVILSHDHVKRDRLDPNLPFRTETRIGNSCFIGIGTIILPGVVIGDNVIIGAGSIVTKNIESNVIAAGNPCRVLKKDVKIGKYGIVRQ